MISPASVLTSSYIKPSATEGLTAGGANVLNSQSAVPVSDPTRIQKSSRPDTEKDASTNASSRNPSGASVQEKANVEQQIQQVINQLKSRDAEVKAHEMAHLSAAGGYATGGASYVYQVGPDGRQYAIGGEVGIDTSPIPGNPEATLQKAMVVKNAALAPAEPSSQDMKVARAAMQMASEARVEITQQKSQKSVSEVNKEDSGDQTKTSAEPASIKVNDQSQSEQNRIESSGALQAEGALQAQRSGFDLRLVLQAIP